MDLRARIIYPRELVDLALASCYRAKETLYGRNDVLISKCIAADDKFRGCL